MAIRAIRKEGDPILEKKCKPVKEVSDRTRELVDDMLETMYDAGGVGLAAPQVGILKRIVVIDVSEDQSQPLILINPEIIETEGEQRGQEGCLSVPGMAGIVTRPNHVKVKAQDLEMQPVELEGEGLLARAFCHELDHLDGVLYTSLAEGELIDLEAQAQEEAEEEED